MALEYIRRQLIEGWKGHPAGALCLELLDYFEQAPAQELSFITYRSILGILDKKKVDEDIIAAIHILTSTRLNVLDSLFLFVDDNDKEFSIDLFEIAQFRQSGAFVHPETGEVVDDAESKLVPYFAATPALVEELK